MKKMLPLFFTFTFYISHVFSQGTWTQKASLPDTARGYGVGFSIGNYGYVGLGWDLSTGLHDFWQYNPSTNTWLQKASFPGHGTTTPATFVIGHKAYVVTGSTDPYNSNNCKENWEYDANRNNWTKKAEFPGISRTVAVGFAIGGKGYVGTGYDSAGNVYNDFYAYDTATDIWTKKNNFPGASRYGSIAFAVGNKGYLCFGAAASLYMYSDMWQYDTGSDAWTQKSKCPTDSFYVSAGFTIGTNIYVGNGQEETLNNNFSKFWKYNTITDSWTQEANFIGPARGICSAFAIADSGYMGLGFDVISTMYNDWYKFFDDTLTGINEISNTTNGISLYPNPNNGVFKVIYHSEHGEESLPIIEIYNVLGEKVYSQFTTQNSPLTIDLSNQPNGIYLYRVLKEDGSLVGSGKVVIAK